MSQSVAFIGLGNMGGPMAANLVKAGFVVHAFDQVDAAMQKALDAGCVAAASAKAAVDGADFVVTMLPSGPIVETVYLGDDGLLAQIDGALVIDCSTVGPDNSRRVAGEASRRGLRFVDAPVSGGVAGAGAGTLTFMCGGSETDVEAARVVLSPMGANTFRAGDNGAGSAAKICNNMLLAIHMIGTAEALQLGVNNGLDPKVLSHIMTGSSGDNWSLDKYNPWPGVADGVPASRGYQGGFLVKLMQKDLRLAMQAALDSGSRTPMGALANALYGIHGNAADGNTDLDFSSIQRLFGAAGD